MDRITLRGIRFEGHHGVSEEERSLPQLFEVDLQIELDLSIAGRTDDLDDTVDYGPLVEVVRDVVERSSHRLMEAIAAAIAEGVHAVAPRVEEISVRVRKLAVPLDADLDHAEVEVQRRWSPPPA